MKKEKITCDQLAVLSFLKFANLNGLDMTLLKDDISDITEVVFNDETDDYFVMADGTIMLKKCYIDKFYKNVDVDLFDSIQITRAYRRLDQIDIIKFVLKKIKLLGEGFVIKDEINDNFSFSQLNVINQLYKEGYIMDYVHKDRVYGDYVAIKLTKRGDLYLFLTENNTEINKFCELLKENGYDYTLLQAFLITQNLLDDVDTILTLDKFIAFCNEYDVCSFLEDKKNGPRRILEPIKQ